MRLRRGGQITCAIGVAIVSALCAPLIAQQCNYGCQIVLEGEAQDGFFYEFQQNRSAVMFHTLWANNFIPSDVTPNAWKRGEGEQVCPANAQTPGEATVTPTDPTWTNANTTIWCNGET